jgi:hypothetical protein
MSQYILKGEKAHSSPSPIEVGISCAEFMKTNYQDPQTSEIRSTHISGAYEALGKIEDILDMQLQAETGVALNHVFTQYLDPPTNSIVEYRIYQAPAGKRNWASSPAPVIKKNGVAITEGYTIDYAGGAIIVSPGAISTDAFTADVSRLKAQTRSYEGKKCIINSPYRFGGSLHLKGQMHDHTLNSDGANTPTDLATAYKNAGYHFITITDHDVVTTDPAVAGITWIGNSVEDTVLRHVIGYDITAQSTEQDMKSVIDYYYQNGNICSIPHSNWPGVYTLTEDEIKYLFGYQFIEVFNNLTGGTDGICENQWDYALSASRKVFGLAVDDCHDVNNAAWFNKGWVVVHANENSKAAIWESLKNGNFYASTGNDISISVDGNVITATSLTASNITFIGENGKVLQTNNGVTTASYTIKGDEMYIRVRSIKVSDSTYAWSQPIFVELVGDNDKIVYEKDSNTRNELDMKGFGFDLSAYKANVKQISTCEADEGWVNNAWWGAVGVYAADTVNYKTGLASAKLTGSVNTTGISLVKAVDLTKFDDDSDSEATDYICFVVYIDQANLDLLPANGIAIVLPCDVKPTYTNYLVKGVLKSLLTAGYNFIKLAKSAFAAIGTATFADIKGVCIYINGTPTASASLSVDNIQLIKKDPLADNPNPFQSNSGRHLAISDGEWFVGEEFSALVCRNMNPVNSRMSLMGAVPFADFRSTSIVVTRAAYAFGHSAGLSSTNCIRTYIDGSTIYLSSYKNNVAEIAKTLIMAAPIKSGDTVKFEIIRKGKTIILNVYINYATKPYTITASTSLTELLFLGMQSSNLSPMDIKYLGITGTTYADKASEAYIARTVVQKEKAGAFTTVELNKGDFGVDTTNHRLYIKYADGTLKYASLT